MVGEYLEGRGFEVDYAADGLDGYRLAAENSYDVIVLDLMMPRLDGIEVCKRLREEARKSTPVLMLTARDTLDEKLTGLSAGADDYLTRHSPSGLDARLRALIGASAPGGARCQGGRLVWIRPACALPRRHGAATLDDRMRMLTSYARVAARGQPPGSERGYGNGLPIRTPAQQSLNCADDDKPFDRPLSTRAKLRLPGTDIPAAAIAAVWRTGCLAGSRSRCQPGADGS